MFKDELLNLTMLHYRELIIEPFNGIWNCFNTGKLSLFAPPINCTSSLDSPINRSRFCCSSVLYACTAFTSDSKPSLSLLQSIMSHNKELQHSGIITRSKKWTSSSILKLSLIDELLVDVALSIVAIVVSFRTDVEGGGTGRVTSICASEEINSFCCLRHPKPTFGQLPKPFS